MRSSKHWDRGSRNWCIDVDWLLLFALFLVHECLNVHDSITVIIFLLGAKIILGIRPLLICFSYDALSHCFLHKIDLWLADKLHVSVGERDKFFGSSMPSSSADSGSWRTSNLLCGREHQEGIWFSAEVEIPAEAGADKELGVCFKL